VVFAELFDRHRSRNATATTAEQLHSRRTCLGCGDHQVKNGDEAYAIKVATHVSGAAESRETIKPSSRRSVLVLA